MRRECRKHPDGDWHVDTCAECREAKWGRLIPRARLRAVITAAWIREVVQGTEVGP